MGLPSLVLNESTQPRQREELPRIFPVSHVFQIPLKMAVRIRVPKCWSASRAQKSPRARANLPNSTGKSHWGKGVTAEDMRTLRWVQPKVVAEVTFTEWTEAANLRHASFVGLRTDKSARAVRREVNTT